MLLAGVASGVSTTVSCGVASGVCRAVDSDVDSGVDSGVAAGTVSILGTIFSLGRLVKATGRSTVPAANAASITPAMRSFFTTDTNYKSRLRLGRETKR